MRLQNKRKNVSAKGVIPVGLTALIVLIPALCLVYLSVDGGCKRLGKELKALDAEIVELSRRCRNEEVRWTSMKAPGELDKAIRRWHLPMTWPAEQQVVRLTATDVIEAFEPASRAQRTLYAQAGRIRGND
ncbi:MAG: hypothetical protein WCL44_02445 [bacterium]